MSVRVEKNGAVTTVVLSRPEVRNAVDRETAQSLVDAFRQFDKDPEARVGVLFGDNGTFCAGADLKSIAAGNHNRTEPCSNLCKPIRSWHWYMNAGNDVNWDTQI